ADAGLEVDPEDPEWLYLKGLSALKEGALNPPQRAALFRDGRAALVRAYKIRPNHVPTLYRYARSFFGQPNEPSENTTNTLYQAMTLSPQVDEIIVTASYALMLRGDFAAALPRLKQVAYSPHGSLKLIESALSLIEDAQARRIPAMPAIR